LEKTNLIKTQFQNYLLKKPETELTYPFGADVEVYKVKGKMFATLAIGKMGKGDEQGNLHWWMNLKCDPDEALMLRDIFPSVIPGYHMNKKHWNTVSLNGSIPSDEIAEMIDMSYDLVVKGLKKADREKLEAAE